MIMCLFVGFCLYVGVLIIWISWLGASTYFWFCVLLVFALVFTCLVAYFGVFDLVFSVFL